MTSSAVTSRPRSVTVAFALWLLTIVLGIVSSLFVLFVTGVSGATNTPIGIDTAAYSTAAIIAIVLSLIGLIFARKMRAGRNWARIVLLVLAALQVVSTFAKPGANDIWSWASLATVVIATVLTFTPSANPFFSRKGISS